MLKLLILFAALVNVHGRCPNGCASDGISHGICGGNNKCNCYRNWGGADCSLKLCQSHSAWIDTALGDVNGDGKIDMTINKRTIFHSDPNKRSKERIQAAYVTEGYPLLKYGLARKVDFQDANKRDFWDEAHFSAECSNKGLCNHRTGTCDCFPGYTGPGCEITDCPRSTSGKTCHGHGICAPAFSKLGEMYGMWDKEKTFKCECDQGYGGPDCSQRMCAIGPDPVKHNQFVTSSVQKVAFFEYDVASGSNEISRIDDTVHFTITVRDDFGDEWTTASIPIQYKTVGKTVSPDTTVYADDTTYDEDSHLNYLQRNVTAALSALPDSAVSGLRVWVQKRITKSELGAYNSGQLNKKLGTFSDCSKGSSECDEENHIPMFRSSDEVYRDMRCGGDDGHGDDPWLNDGTLAKADGAGEVATVQESLCIFIASGNDIKTNYRIEYQHTTGADGKGEVHEGQSFDIDDHVVNQCNIKAKEQKMTSSAHALCQQLPHRQGTHAQQSNYGLAGTTDGAVQLVTVQDVSAYRRYPLTTNKESFNKNYRSGKSLDAASNGIFTNAATLYFKGVEHTECSSRGLCDYETGKCGCFAGYSGANCMQQMAVGS